jgi:hypothetical protein
VGSAAASAAGHRLISYCVRRTPDASARPTRKAGARASIESMTPPSDPTTATLRASDAEREAVATRLREAASTGHLTITEADERQAAAYAAVTREELVPLTADLPTVKAAVPPPARPSRRGTLTDGSRRRLAVHATVVGFLAVFFVTRWVMDPEPWFWPAWPMFWLGLSLLLHHRVATRRASPPATA